MTESDVSICNHEIKAHLFQKLCADRLPYRVDYGHKGWSFNNSMQRLKPSYATCQI
jgi:hypothetical protein